MHFALLSNIFPPHIRGGYELGCQAIARALIRRGHQVEIVTSASIGQLNKAASTGDLRVGCLFEPIFEYEELLIERLRASRYWNKRRDEAFGGLLIPNALSLSRFLQESKPDVVWIFNPVGLGPIGILEATLSHRSKCIIHLMDDIDGTFLTHQRCLFLEGRYRRLKSCFTAISCSRKILSKNERIGSYRSHRVIYNGVDFNQIPYRPDSPHRTDGRCHFVYFGQVSKQKGILQMLRGARAANTRAFTLDIIGRPDSTFEERLKDEIRAAGLCNEVNLLGFLAREDLLARLGEYDAAVMLLSDAEPFAFAPIEAVAAGLPVILTSGGGNAECFPERYPLMVHDREDQEEIARKLEWCVHNVGELPRLGRRLRDHVRVHCDFESVVMPAYLRTIKTAPINAGRFCVEDLLSSWTTTKLYNEISWRGEKKRRSIEEQVE